MSSFAADGRCVFSDIFSTDALFLVFVSLLNASSFSDGCWRTMFCSWGANSLALNVSLLKVKYFSLRLH